MKIVHNIAIRTTRDRFLEAVTTQRGLAGWFTPETTAEPKVGSLCTFSFDSRYTLSFRVVALDRRGRVVWAPVQAPPTWKRSRVTFAAVPRGKTVEFTFTHSGLPARYEDLGFFSYCWGQYVRSLKLLLETGRGEPYGTPASRAWHPLD